MRMRFRRPLRRRPTKSARFRPAAADGSPAGPVDELSTGPFHISRRGDYHLLIPAATQSFL